MLGPLSQSPLGEGIAVYFPYLYFLSARKNRPEAAVQSSPQHWRSGVPDFVSTWSINCDYGLSRRSLRHVKLCLAPSRIRTDIRLAIIIRNIVRVPESRNESHSFDMAYRQGRTSIRQMYEEHFLVDDREVTVHRVVNVVKRGPGQEYNPGYIDDQWHAAQQSYQDAREYYDNGCYPPPECRYFDDNPGFRRNSPPPRHDYLYHQPGLGRHDLRHQLDSRSRGRPRPHYHSRGRGSGPPQRLPPERKPHPEDFDVNRSSLPVAVKRGRSPGSREGQPPVRSGSNTSSRNFSPDKGQGSVPHQDSKKSKPNVPPSQTPSSTLEDSAHSSAPAKNQLPDPVTSPLTPEPLACQERTAAASVAEMKKVVKEEEEEEKEEVAASTEPKPTPEEGFKARRSEAIKAKALEIKKLYTQDCETFRTVVKMLVTKEPRLDELLQHSLDKNLLEMRQRCLDDLRHFVKELDQIIAQGREMANLDNRNPFSISHVLGEEEFLQLSSINPTDAYVKQEERSHCGHSGDTGHAQSGEKGEEKPLGSSGESERKANACPPPRENGSSAQMKAMSESPSSPGPTKRLQLYGSRGEKLKHNYILNPKMWQNITYFRPGWVPERLPYLHSDRYWELKANSTVVSTSVPPYSKDQKADKVPCGVTCYIHAEGPWCEIQASNGTRICILVAEPQNEHH